MPDAKRVFPARRGVCCRDGRADALRRGWRGCAGGLPARPIRVVTPFPAGDQRYGDPHRVRRLRPRSGSRSSSRVKAGAAGAIGTFRGQERAGWIYLLASSGPVFTVAAHENEGFIPTVTSSR